MQTNGPQTLSASANGPWTDFITGDGLCTTILNIGSTGLTGNITVSMQEADDSSGTNSQNVSGGAMANKSTQGQTLLTFQRTKRFLRAVMTVAGGNVLADVICFEQLKQL